jgi:hypothetical protein
VPLMTTDGLPHQVCERGRGAAGVRRPCTASHTAPSPADDLVGAMGRVPLVPNLVSSGARRRRPPGMHAHDCGGWPSGAL